jgi:hypothetical protein
LTSAIALLSYDKLICPSRDEGMTEEAAASEGANSRWADDEAGHRAVVQPDTYAEASICPSHNGPPAVCNVLIDDLDGDRTAGYGQRA